MSSTMYFGGLEGGATHSNLVIVDGCGAVVGTATGPGTNHWHLGIDACIDRVLQMLHDAKKMAGIPLDQPLDALGLTMSGCEQDSTNAELGARAREKDPHCAKAVYVASDTAGSLYTGAPHGGIVLIAGTGSNALLQTADGRTLGCGGWGHLLGDEGGAYWIAHKAVKTVFDDEDGLRPSPFPTARVWDTIRAHFGVDSRSDLLQHAYGNFDKSKFAALTGKLAEVAAGGDLLSRHLFSEAGRQLADHTAALVSRSRSAAHRTAPCPLRVVCVGSVWRSWKLLQPGLVDQLYRRGVDTELELVRLVVSSARGAAGLAAHHVGYQLPRDDAAFCQVFYKYHPEATADTLQSDKCLNGVGTQTQPEIFETILKKHADNRLTVDNGVSFENGIESGDWNNGS